MTASKAETGDTEPRKTGELDRCYGRIGIPAVAAALPYKSSDRNTAYAPGDDRR